MILMATAVKTLITLLAIALSVGFYTLLERKVIAYMQMRKGPNKTMIIGLPQPLMDALKLFSKEIHPMKKSNKLTYALTPLMGMTVTFILWALYTSPYSITPMKLGILFFIAISSLNVYTLLLSGWSSNSKYAILGATRAIAQTISYEVTMALVLTAIIISSMTFNLMQMTIPQYLMWNTFLMPAMTMIWMISILAETNRAPFDLAEGESELVSGFNIEYGSGEFSFLSIAEYGSILIMSIISSTLFLDNSLSHNPSMSVMKMLIIAYLFLWTRSTYPRMRYDMLMELTWKTFMSITITYLMVTLPFY
nr:NADH dehydrogenase subunit 1 [Exechonella vieirai]